MSSNFPFEDSNFPWTDNELSILPKVPLKYNLDPSEHITNFRIRSYRRFEDMEIHNMGQFNLVLGDNNSGKTTFLETLLFSPNPNFLLFNLLYSKRQRSNDDKFISNHKLLESLVNRNSNNSEILYDFKEQRRYWSYKLRYPTVKELFMKYQIDSLDPRNYLAIESGAGTVKISDSINEILIYFEDPQWLRNMPLIPFGKGYFNKLATNYHYQIGSRRKLKEEFLLQMKSFIPNIVDISIDPETDQIKIEEEINNIDYSSSLDDYGDGANKLFRILVQLHASKGKRLLIDEIDAGIHYSRFRFFWQIILSVARDYNVQLFCTTHNEECIKYFWEILQDSDFESCKMNSRIITFEKHIKTNEIVPIVRDYENMLFSQEYKLEVRGGQL